MPITLAYIGHNFLMQKGEIGEIMGKIGLSMRYKRPIFPERESKLRLS
jgi:hypothetical protein